MPKAAIDFIYKVGKDGRFHQDGEDKYFKKGDVIPPGILPRIAYLNQEFIEEGLDDDKRKKMVDEALKQTNRLIKEKLIEKKEPRYTKEELKKWRKDQQIEELQGFGLSGPEIKKLKYEKDRVNKLFQLYQEEL